MEYDVDRKHSKKIKLKKNDNACGVEGYYRKKSEQIVAITENETQDSPKLDRHGFVVSHQLHSQVGCNNTQLPGQICIKRESKWLEMLRNWNEVVKNKDNKIKVRCRKGIPQSVRSVAWQYLTGANILRDRNPRLYERLVKKSEKSEWGYVIRKDIPRTFRHHSMFYENNSRGQEDLYNVLIAYSTYDNETGYHQALAPIAAVLLMHMPPDATFWTLVSIVKTYLPGFYNPGMLAIRLDLLMFERVLKTELAHISAHMNKHYMEPTTYLVNWFVCIFSRSLPFDTVLRIWDMFFCEGYKILYKVGLAIMKIVFPTLKDLEDMDEYETHQAIATPKTESVTEDVFLQEVNNVDFSYKDLKKVYKKVLEENPELVDTRYTGGPHSL